MRDAIERPEALDAGSIIMTGLDPANVLEGIRAAIPTGPGGVATPPPEYAIANTSERTVNFILSTYRRLPAWTGLHGTAPVPRD